MIKFGLGGARCVLLGLSGLKHVEKPWARNQLIQTRRDWDRKCTWLGWARDSIHISIRAFSCCYFKARELTGDASEWTAEADIWSAEPIVCLVYGPSLCHESFGEFEYVEEASCVPCPVIRFRRLKYQYRRPASNESPSRPPTTAPPTKFTFLTGLVSVAADDEGLDEAGACWVGVNMVFVVCVVLVTVGVWVRIADDSVRSVTTL